MSSFLSFFYIYDPWLFHFIRMAFIMGAIAIGVLCYKGINNKLPQGIQLPVDSLVVSLLLIVISLFPIIIHSSTDFSVIKMYFKGFLLFICGIAVYNLVYLNKDKSALIKDLKLGISVQAVIGFLALLGLPIIIDLALSTNAVYPRFYGSEQEYRLYNLTSSGFFQLSIFYLMLLNFILAYDRKYNTIHGIYILMILFIGLISGRTFLALSVLSILFYFRFKYLPYLILFLAICLLFTFFFNEHKYVRHALEPLINFFYGYGNISSSTDTLVEKHLFKPELRQILIGDGYYYGYYGSTDSGFLRQFLYGGILYMLSCFLFMFYFIRKIALNWFDGSWRFMLSSLVILSVLNIKADAYAFPGIMTLFLMFLSLFGRSGKRITLFKPQRGSNV
ncbi:hypothetical protein EV693_101133 [Nicoletella semolina]|uniref:O-antigen ligase-like membrane protein n=1 Tax=Nicoletella semolina TaxID=271160 RepID=A0A4R2NCJ6_9PAST|nr:hypothetical protein [Nicoletella semolina]MDH2924235.1 hypothetical protein [Nicoletella semolina]TCP18867.1 hypothetical protein EV693_101133 [Nicoletella semolina]